MKKQFTLSIFTENNPGVMQRINIMFTRRKLNLDSITGSETERPGISRITIVLQCEEDLIRNIARQIQRIVEVLHVNVFEDHEVYAKELVFIRVEARDDRDRHDIETLAAQFNASATRDQCDNMILECAAPRSVSDKLCEALKPFRITEFVRSGRIAIPRVGVLHEDAVRGVL